MSQPLPFRIVAIAVAALLASQAACSLNHNNRRGLVMVGGAAVVVGGVITVDGLSCDDSAGGGIDCDDDRGDLAAGLAVLAGGLVVGGLGLYLQRRAAASPAPASP